MYELKYLTLAINDLHGIVDYITNILKAPKYAMDLLDDLESSIFRLKEFPYSCKVYQSVEPLETEYRMFPVKNYMVFYVVTDNIVEIHRIVYARMDLEKLIVEV